MRARNIKPSFFKNPELADAGPLAQLLFIGLWCMADREGLLKDQPRVIKAEVFPYTDIDINRELTVIERLGHVRRIAGDIPLIEVINFKKHQRPHHTERASDFKNTAPHKTHKTPRKQASKTAPLVNGELTVNSTLDHGGNPPDSLIPDSLIQVRKEEEIFVGDLDPSAWHRWVDYRDKVKKPLKEISIGPAQRELAGYGSQQAAVVEQSIANGWQGLFPLKKGQRSKGEWE